MKQVYRFSQARKMFGALDLDSSGTISYEEVSEHLEDPAVQDFFISFTAAQMTVLLHKFA